MKILILNGPNLNMTGIRKKEVYGSQTLDDINSELREYGEGKGADMFFYQSNHEGDLVDAIQAAYRVQDGIVINPGAYTHTSVALLDALKAVGIPAVEVHISDPDARDEFRKVSYIRAACVKTIKGHGFDGSLEAMDFLAGVNQ